MIVEISASWVTPSPEPRSSTARPAAGPGRRSEGYRSDGSTPPPPGSRTRHVGHGTRSPPVPAGAGARRFCHRQRNVSVQTHRRRIPAGPPTDSQGPDGSSTRTGRPPACPLSEWRARPALVGVAVTAVGPRTRRLRRSAEPDGARRPDVGRTTPIVPATYQRARPGPRTGCGPLTARSTTFARTPAGLGRPPGRRHRLSRPSSPEGDIPARRGRSSMTRRSSAPSWTRYGADLFGVEATELEADRITRGRRARTATSRSAPPSDSAGAGARRRARVQGRHRRERPPRRERPGLPRTRRVAPSPASTRVAHAGRPNGSPAAPSNARPSWSSYRPSAAFWPGRRSGRGRPPTGAPLGSPTAPTTSTPTPATRSTSGPARPRSGSASAAPRDGTAHPLAADHFSGRPLLPRVTTSRWTARDPRVRSSRAFGTRVAAGVQLVDRTVA